MVSYIDKFVNLYQPRWIEQTYVSGSLIQRQYVVDRKPIINIYIYPSSGSEEHTVYRNDSVYSSPDVYHRLDGPAIVRPKSPAYTEWLIGGFRVGMGEAKPVGFDATRDLFLRMFPDWQTKGFSYQAWRKVVYGTSK